MPTIEISLRDLEKLAGRRLPRDVDELNDVLQNAKAEVESMLDDEIKINIEDGNRPDLWCAEGVARQIKAAGLQEYTSFKSNFKINVDKRLKNIRPYIACAVVRNVKLSSQVIKQIMQQQDKIDSTYGRNRKRTSIGLYDFNLVNFPLSYTLTKPNENAFVPLTFEKKLTPKQILEQHPKGAEYGKLLEGLKEYPIFMDAKKKVLSMPPVINSDDLGQISEKTKNVLIEVTGTDYKAVNNVLKIIALTLADRGGQIHSVAIDSSYCAKDTTPHLETSKFKLSVKDVNDLLGTTFEAYEIGELLEEARYGAASKNKNFVDVEIPCYRTDIMHAVDIIEDVAIAYGYGNFKPQKLELATTGNLSELEKFSDKVRELCLGFGGQEIMTFTMTNKENLFKKMNLPSSKVIEVENPVSLTYSCLRSWLLPSLLEFLGNNTKKEYPQLVFEAGDVVEGAETIRKLAFASSNANASFTDAKQILESFLANLGLKADVKETEHQSFIPGRVGKIFIGKKEIGIIGEIYPKVLNNWGIEMPVVGFEINLNLL